jgi:hypothetical protein
MRRYQTVLIIILILCSPAAYGWENENIELKIKMANLFRSGPPELYHRTALFTYHQRSFVRYVGIAFDFENFQTIHPFRVNQNNVFIFPLEIPEGLREIRYRIVVDGLWMTDPRNPNQVVDHKGNILSSFSFTPPEKTVLESPLIYGDGTVEFSVKYFPGRRVFLTGDFSNWEPFMIEMEETSPGLYIVSRSFLPGSYEYCFIAGGARITDPLNPTIGVDPHGYLASRFTVE